MYRASHSRTSRPVRSRFLSRELFAKAGAALAGFSAVQAASAKAGQFSKQSVFDIVGSPALSSPYQPGGPQGDGPGTTYGFKKSDGPILAEGYQSDVTREKAAFDVSSKIVRAQVRHTPHALRARLGGFTDAALASLAALRRRRPHLPFACLGLFSSQGPNIESKTWWLVRDNLRGQAYNMKANMLAMNAVSKDKVASKKAYSKFWSEINQLDLACTKKEYDLAKKEYEDVLAALAAYDSVL